MLADCITRFIFGSVVLCLPKELLLDEKFSFYMRLLKLAI